MNPEEFWKRMEHVPYMQGHPVLAQVAAPVARVSPEAGSAPAPVARVSPEAGAASAGSAPAPVAGVSPEAGQVACREQLLPFGVHGDGAQFTKLDTMVALTWSSILASGRNPLDTRFLVATLPQTWLLQGTMNEVLQVFAWSLAACADGKFPATDYLGRPWPARSSQAKVAGTLLAGGFKGIVVDFRGDWSWHKELWDCRAWSGLEICHACRATLDGERTWTDFSEVALWRRSPQRTTEEYLQEHPAATRNRLCLLPGWQLGQIRWDVMHSVNLGVARLAGACGILDLVSRGVFGQGDLPMQLKAAWARFRTWCRRHRIQCNARRFTVGRLNAKGKNWPELSSRAWNTRVICGWLSSEASQAIFPQRKQRMSHV